MILLRPTKLSEYIGQPRAKKLLDIYLQCKDEQFPHTIISGRAGQGKSTLAYCIANELGYKYFEFIASSTDANSIIELIKNNPKCLIFLDEIHGIDRKEVEKLYSLMEDFKLNGKYCHQFTLLGATTELGEMLKDRRPFYERFKISIQLDDYEVSDLSDMITKYDTRLFGEQWINQECSDMIANWCRYNPRIAIKMYDLFRRTGKSSDLVEAFDIKYDNGLTKQDDKLLRYLANAGTVGLQGICAYLNINVDYYLQEIEPLLLREDYIVRMPRGRKISQKGLALIGAGQYE